MVGSHHSSLGFQEDFLQREHLTWISVDSKMGEHFLCNYQSICSDIKKKYVFIVENLEL